MGLPYFLKWTCAQDTIKFEYTYLTLKKRCSERMMATSNSLSCHLGLLMPQPYFKGKWIVRTVMVTWLTWNWLLIRWGKTSSLQKDQMMFQLGKNRISRASNHLAGCEGWPKHNCLHVALAITLHPQGSSWILGFERILQEVHLKLWSNCRSPDKDVAGQLVPMDWRSQGIFPTAQASHV